jgi:hypothetical protein
MLVLLKSDQLHRVINRGDNEITETMPPESFTSHIAFEKLKQLHQVLTSDNAKQKIPLTDATFFDAAFKYVDDRLKLTLSILVPETEMSPLANELDAVTVQLNAFLGNSNPGHLKNATNSFNTVLVRIRNFPFPLQKGSFDFSKAVASFEKTAADAYRSLEDQNKNLQQELKTTKEDLKSKQKQITELATKLAVKETEIQTVLVRYNSEFENPEEPRIRWLTSKGKIC